MRVTVGTGSSVDFGIRETKSSTATLSMVTFASQSVFAPVVVWTKVNFPRVWFFESILN